MANQGLGKTLFREHNKRITQALKSFEKGLKDGYLFTPDDFDASMEQILANFEQDADDNDAPNTSTWRERLQDRIEEKRQYFEEKFPGIFESVEYAEDAEDDYDVNEAEVSEEDDILDEGAEGGYIDIDGIPVQIIDKSTQAYYRAMGYIRRSITIPSVEELQEYAKDIPYLMGIEAVYSGGYFEGFTVWIEYN